MPSGAADEAGCGILVPSPELPCEGGDRGAASPKTFCSEEVRLGCTSGMTPLVTTATGGGAPPAMPVPAPVGFAGMLPRT